ncbi:MAG: nickel pincer cofactor biosynthesis protein LarC [Thermoguttaceae bacterium]|nr:nickel pincer cofactor biosynthesis protein LarC [Thermoguttaceae bacterium]
MKAAWFDCHSGISGDMTLGALLDAGVPIDVIRSAVQAVLPSITIDAQSVMRHGFRATQALVDEQHDHEHEHHDHDHHDHDHGDHEHHDHDHHHAHCHRTMADICAMVLNAAGLTDKVKTEVIGVFELIAQAEARAHGCEVEQVHFHEVGAADSIADIVGAVTGLNWLGVEAVYASAVPTGCGTIQIAHGEVSVPAPATAQLLTGVPLAPSDVPFELTTPTGAGLLKYYVKSFGQMPPMTIEKIGVGAGGRDLPQQANTLRLVLGELADAPAQSQGDSVWQIETNIDDMPGELFGRAVEELWKLNPLDVWTTAVNMKKQRPGVVVSVLCREDQIKAVESALFTHTTTLGVRKWKVDRTVLKRESCQIRLNNGQTVTGKSVILPDGSQRIVPEYEDVCRIAQELGVPVLDLYRMAQK